MPPARTPFPGNTPWWRHPHTGAWLYTWQGSGSTPGTTVPYAAYAVPRTPPHTGYLWAHNAPAPGVQPIRVVTVGGLGTGTPSGVTYLRHGTDPTFYATPPEGVLVATPQELAVARACCQVWGQVVVAHTAAPGTPVGVVLGRFGWVRGG